MKHVIGIRVVVLVTVLFSGAAGSVEAIGNGRIRARQETGERGAAGEKLKDRPTADRARWQKARKTYTNLSDEQKVAMNKVAIKNIDEIADWTEDQKKILKNNVSQLVKGWNQLGEAEQQALIHEMDKVKALPMEQKMDFVDKVRGAAQASLDAMSPEQKKNLGKMIQDRRQKQK